MDAPLCFYWNEYWGTDLQNASQNNRAGPATIAACPRVKITRK
jgi:hypothetical protein